MKTSKGVIVLGLDGAAFELINPWIDEGCLPNIRYLIKNGVCGDLKSCLPPVTSPAWKCYSTGKNPGKLGVFWWEMIDKDKHKITHPNSKAFQSREIWDYMSDLGLEVGIFNMPTTYPPKPVNGFMVAGGPDCGNDNFTFPVDLQKKLEDDYDYSIHPDMEAIDIYEDKAVQEIYRIIDQRFHVAIELLKARKPDFLHITIFYINVLHHFLWNDVRVRKAWQMIDENIGKILELADDYNLIIMSDHGANEIGYTFNLNTWLEKEGYLVTRKSASDILDRIGINKERIRKTIDIINVKEGSLKRLLPDFARKIIPSCGGIVGRDGKAEKILWDESIAVGSGQGPIYILVNEHNDGPVYYSLRDEIIEKLKSLKEPFTGKKAIRKVYKREEIYSGKSLDKAPDLILDQNIGVHVTGTIGHKSVFNRPQRWRAENKREGLFIAFGSDIKPNGRINDLSIFDLAPTILHMLNLPVPDDMDGKVLKGIFADGSMIKDRNVKFMLSNSDNASVFSAEDQEKVKRRLEQIGYL
jgi:predicted AlkP superfamily phosphohydrolase/phosphomutase